MERYGIEEQLKELLARKCGGDHAPAELKQRLRDSIRETVAEYTEVQITEHHTEVHVQRQTTVEGQWAEGR